jgi:NADH dehydrogenase
MKEPLKIVCVGGGYVSIYLMKKLRRAIKLGLVKVFIIDRNNFHTFHGLVPEMLSGKIQSSQVISPARKLFKGADFHNAEVVEIDTVNQKVVLERILDERRYELAYDHLVIGVGTRSHMSRYRGIGQHAMQLKTFWDCYTVRNHILAKLEMADDENDSEIRQRLLTFLVAGGNYAGIETVAELTEFLEKTIKREYPQINVDELRMVLVHSRDHILPELQEHYPKLSKYAQEYLEERPHLELKLNARMQSASPNEVILDTGEVIPTNTIISCTGTDQWPLLEQVVAERNKDNRMITNKFGQVNGFDNVWSAGDCAAIPHPKGGDSPPLAIYAMTGGALIGRNLKRLAQGKSLKPYKFTGLGDACVLGTFQAVGHVYGVQFRGFPAWLAWRGFMIFYLPTWDRRFRTISDWIIGPLVGRDIVAVRPMIPPSTTTQMYENGQIIMKQGKPAMSMFAVRSGEVELIDEATGTMTHLLKKGDHFGATDLFADDFYSQTARAKGPVEILKIPEQQARHLSSTLPIFAQAIREGDQS